MAILEYLIYFLISLIISFLLTPLAIKIATKLEIIDFPGKTTHTIHHSPVPRAGGLVIFITLLIIVLVFNKKLNTEITVTLLGSLIIFAFGLWDDRFGMKAPLKLFGQILAITILILNGIRVQFFENPQFFITLSPNIEIAIDIAVTFFWLIAITNAFNLIDSMDGLALGVTQVILVFFLLSFTKSNQTALLFLSLVLLGISMGIFFYNKLPAKTFLGDSGAQMLGFILGVLAILYYPVGAKQSSTWFAPVVVFGVPIFDTTLVTFSRLRKQIPFYKANLDHTYHRLVQLGLSSKNSVRLIHLSSILFAILAYWCISLDPLPANILFLLWLIGFFYAIYWFELKLDQKLHISQ